MCYRAAPVGKTGKNLRPLETFISCYHLSDFILFSIVISSSSTFKDLVITLDSRTQPRILSFSLPDSQNLIPSANSVLLCHVTIYL